MGREDHGLTGIGNFVQFLDEDGTLGFEAFHNVPVVDDLVPHIHRRSKPLQRKVHDLDCPIDAGTEAARTAEQDVEGPLGRAHEVTGSAV
jgi:hypothetical protein